MVEKRKPSQIEQLRRKAKLMGIDADALLTEFTGIVVDKATPIIAEKVSDILSEKVTAKIESKVAVVLGEAIEGLKQVAANPQVDIKAVVKGVTDILEPKIIEATTSQITTSVKALTAELRHYIDTTIQEKTQPPQPGGGSDGSQVATGGLATVGGLLQFLIANADSVTKLAQVFRPPPSPEVKATELLGMSLRLAGKIDKVQKGSDTIESLTSEIANTLNPPKK